MEKQALTQATIVEAVGSWSKEEQLQLIRSLLFQLGPVEAEMKNPFPHVPTFEQAAGFLKTDKPVPSDEEVEKILRERREERYG